MKYPIKFQGKKELLKLPIQTESGGWNCGSLGVDGALIPNGFAEHHTKESCQICCSAHNNRVGYTVKAVKKIIKKLSDVKEKKGEKTKGKNKGKNKGSSNKSKNRKKKRSS